MSEFSCCSSTEGDKSNTLVCKSCKSLYHIQCIQPDNKKVTKEFKAVFLCPGCQSMTRRIKSDSTPVRSGGGTREIKDCSSTGPLMLTPESQNIVKSYALPPSSSTSTSTAIDIVMIIRTKVGKLKDELTANLISTFKSLLSNELSTVKEELRDIKTSMEFLNREYTAMTSKITDMEVKVKKCDAVVSEVEALKSSLRQLQGETNMKNQWARRSNIEIIGIPENRNENLMELVRDIATRANFALTTYDVDFVTRVAPSTSDANKTKPIVLRMIGRSRKDEFMHALKSLRGLKASSLGFNGKDSAIFFNDHLTKYNKMLLQQAKTMVKERNYKYVWVKHCTIMVRCSDTSRVIHIGCEEDLKKIV